MRIIVLLSAVAFFLTGCAEKPMPFVKEHTPRGFEAGREFLVGKWLGEAPLQGGGKRVWLSQRFDDGTYVVTFQAFKDGECVSEQSEFGDWGLSGDIYFTMTRGHGAQVSRAQIVGRRASYGDDAYRITKLTPEEFHYTSVATERSYIVKKVAADFSLKKKPNQTPEPTPPAGTSAAEQPLVPSAVVAHH